MTRLEQIKRLILEQKELKVKVDSGELCDWQKIVPLQPQEYKQQNSDQKERLMLSILISGFHDALDVWDNGNQLYSIDGVHRKIALLSLMEMGLSVPDLLPCVFVKADNISDAATMIMSRNTPMSSVVNNAAIVEACAIPAKVVSDLFVSSSINTADNRSQKELGLPEQNKSNTIDSGEHAVLPTNSISRNNTTTDNEPIDYTVLDEYSEEMEKAEGMVFGVRKAIQIEFEYADYDEANKLVAKARKGGLYVGRILIDGLKAYYIEKD